MNNHGLTKETILFTLPVALRHDKSVSALAEAIAELLSLRPNEIDLLRIYPEIDRLNEPLLGILAHDFKVDWWDTEYSIEAKRQTLKDNWLVHKRLGTRYAVETALNAVFPGASVSEWFEYGGTPYCFRLDLPIPEEGVTAERQRRVMSRVWYYKNLRSHLESVNLSAESVGFVHLGACSTTKAVIEIWPELVSNVEVTGGTGIGTVHSTKQCVEVYPELVRQVDLTGQAASGALTVQRQRVEVWPELASKVETLAQTGSDGLLTQHQILEIYPDCAEGESK